MDAPSGLPSLASLIGSLQRGQTVHYLHVASACLFFYDHLTTVADEIALIWRAPWSTGKVLFIASRYIAWPEFLVSLSIELFEGPEGRCYSAFVYISWSIVAGITVAETVLVLRTWAIWGGRRIVVLGLAFLLLVITAVNAWIMVEYAKRTRVTQLPGIVGCVVTSSSHTIGLAWINISAFEFVIVSMTVAKGIEHFRSSSSTLLASLYRDGILYYVFLLAVSLANMIFVISAPAEYIVLLAELQRAFHAILSCRIILNLRAVRSAPRIASSRTETVSGWFGAKDQRVTASASVGFSM